MSADDLQNKIQQKLGFLTTSVDTLKEQQRTLMKNSDKAKFYVHASCDKDLNLLKLKERNLLHQLEIVTENQNKVLDTQITKLLQIRGSLRATQRILHECQFDDLSAMTTLYDGYVDGLIPVDDVNTLSVENLIESAMIAFKSLNLPDKTIYELRSARFEEASRLVSEGFEKYLQERESNAVGENAATKIYVPKIPNGEWLAKSSSSLEQCQVKDAKKCCNALPKLNESQPLSAWLVYPPMSEGSESSRPGGSSSFDLLDDDCEVSTPLPGGFPSPLVGGRCKSRCSSFSSSIEVVSSLDLEKEFANGNDISNNKSCWLTLSRSSDFNKKQDSFMPVDVEEFACQANEPCSSYRECLCNGYCKDLAKERALQTSKWLLKNELEHRASPTIREEGIKASNTIIEEGKRVTNPTGIKRKLSPSDGGNEVLKHMRGILSSDPTKWLHRSLKTELNSALNILYTPRSESWLCDENKKPGVKGDESHPGVTYSPHSNIWLLHKLKEERKKDQEEKKNRIIQETENRTHDFDQSNAGGMSVSGEHNVGGLSVSDLKGALEELSVLLPKYSPTSFNSNSSRLSAFYPHNSTHAASILTHNINNLYRNNDFDLSRKLKWLSRSQSRNQNNGSGHSLPQTSPNFLPESLVVFAERNLDKWLMNRL